MSTFECNIISGLFLSLVLLCPYSGLLVYGHVYQHFPCQWLVFLELLPVG